MGIVLVHHEVIFIGIRFCTLIADHNTRRYACGAHQISKGTRIVFAEPSHGVEQELIYPVFSKQRRIQCVEILIHTKMCEHRVRVLFVGRY